MLPSPFLLGAASREDKITRIGAARIGVGSLTLVTGLAARLFGAPPEQVTPTARMMTRLFGVRNIVLGVWALGVREASPEEQRRCFRLNAAVDVADVVVLAPFLLRSDLRRAAFMASALGVSATLAWLDLLAST
jgi:hypothetical protein